MTRTAFIGREAELGNLLDAVDGAASRRGRIVLVEGGLGFGKSTLIDELKRRLLIDPRTQSVRATTGFCYEGGTESSYHSFVEALSQLATHGPKRSVSKLTLDLIRQVGPDLLRVIPVLGDAAAAGAKALSVAGDWWLGASADDNRLISRNIPLQFTDTILALAEAQGPLLLVIEDMHWADAASAQLILRLSHRIEEYPLLIVATYRREETLEGSFAGTRRELLASGRGSAITLQPFTEEEIERYVALSYGGEVAGALTPWLHELSGGQPLFVASYLGLLEKKGSLQPPTDSEPAWRIHGDFADLPVPDGVGAILEARLARLSDEERRILESSSVQGQRFYAVITAEVLGMEEMPVVEVLKEVATREDLVRFHPSDQWTEEWTDTFSFADQLLQRVLYARLTDRQKTLQHRRIGGLLQERLQLARVFPIGALIEAAHHLDRGREWERASLLFLDAAKLSHENGAFNDAAQLCERALALINTVGSADMSSAPAYLSPQLRAARARCVQLLLLSSELRWFGAEREAGPGPSTLDLLRQADEDAAAVEDAQLQAQLTYLRARVAVVRESLPAAIELYQSAVRQAVEAGDQLGEVVALTELGHHLIGADVVLGLATLKSAEDKWHVLEPMLEEHVPAALLARQLHRLQGSIGVAEFDCGRFDPAEKYLRAALDGLRLRRMPDLYSTMSNFLAQLYTAEGRFEEGERILLETIDILKSEDGAVAHRGYNLSLLGKLYLEWERPGEAFTALSRAFETTRDTVNEAVLPLIRNYYCELLVRSSSSDQDNRLADELLQETIAEVSRSGFQRSAAAAQTIYARLLLHRDRPLDALEHTQIAVTTLDAYGILPALRSEEVLFAHARALEANGQLEDAKTFYARAMSIISEKAASISDESRRYQYLNRIPLNRLIRQESPQPTGGEGVAESHDKLGRP